jgi:hypothetical protein
VSPDTIAAIVLWALLGLFAVVAILLSFVIPGRRQAARQRRARQAMEAEAETQRELLGHLRTRAGASRRRPASNSNQDAADLLDEAAEMARQLFGAAAAPALGMLTSSPRTSAGFDRAVSQLEETGPPPSVEHRRFNLFIHVLRGEAASLHLANAIAAEPEWSETLRAELERLGPDPDRDWSPAGVLHALRGASAPSMAPDLVRLARGLRAMRQLEREGLYHPAVRTAAP